MGMILTRIYETKSKPVKPSSPLMILLQGSKSELSVEIHPIE